jgi:hypothetical protein
MPNYIKVGRLARSTFLLYFFREITSKFKTFTCMADKVHFFVAELNNMCRVPKYINLPSIRCHTHYNKRISRLYNRNALLNNDVDFRGRHSLSAERKVIFTIVKKPTSSALPPVGSPFNRFSRRSLAPSTTINLLLKINTVL